MFTDMHAWKQAQIAAARKQALPILSFPGAGLLGISVKDLVTSADNQARGMKAVADRVPAAAAVSMMDLSVEAEAFGAQVHVTADEVPAVTGVLVGSLKEAEALAIPPVGAARTGLYVAAVEQALHLIADRPVFAGVIGPFSLAARLMGVSDIMMACYDEPEAVALVLTKATRFLTDYIKAYQAAGAHGVVIAEPVAGLLSPALAAEFSSPYVKQIREATASPRFLVIYHNCSNNVPLMLDAILATGCDGYHFGDAVDLAALADRVPGDVLLMGNISPAAQFSGGSPDSIREAALGLLHQLAPHHPNFIISSGCDIPPGSPWANIDAFFDAVTAFYQQQN